VIGDLWKTLNSRENALKKRSVVKPRSGEIFIAQGESANPGYAIQKHAALKAGKKRRVCQDRDHTLRFEPRKLPGEQSPGQALRG